MLDLVSFALVGSRAVNELSLRESDVRAWAGRARLKAKSRNSSELGLIMCKQTRT